MRINKTNLMALLAVLLFMVSCSDNDGPSYSEKPLADNALKEILIQKGFHFNADGQLLIDTKADTTTTLDLSGTKLDTTALADLSILPHLSAVDLSNNGYGPRFNFGLLPQQITSVNLSGNEIYEYPGLLDIQTADNGDETVKVLHPLSKLLLPHSAQYNCAEIPTYFAKEKTSNMEMQDSLGELKPYTTLREVPDDTIRKRLKTSYPSIFRGDKIDISKRFVNVAEKTRNLDLETLKYKSLEGIEYVAMNPSYSGSIIDVGISGSHTHIPYIKVNKFISDLFINNMDVNYLNIDEDVNLCGIIITHNKFITSLDLSKQVKLGQRDIHDEFAQMDLPSYIQIDVCDNLQSIKFPPKATLLFTLEAYALPKLKSLDLSQFSSMFELSLGDLPECAGLKYPDIKNWFNGEEIDNVKGIMYFGITKDMDDLSTTKAFLDKNHTHCISGGFSDFSAREYDWTKDYK
ncbi:hypothetical protein NG821_00825 [Prevotella cerevisiae]|uniref:Uncharacterized protein n=1 Tax=Segatella cerevisiae TaxID=2053716 RepID=A0ABT1BTJ1_9BACT|nr:hypothetical protein [Segatella cerevisiae]MCO6024399.1 hypothetical protein [Segatella cerevisiae]